MLPDSLPYLLISGFEPSKVEELTQAVGLGDRLPLCSEPGAAAVGIAVIADPSEAARAVVDRILDGPQGEETHFLILNAGDAPERFQDLLDRDRLVFLTTRLPGIPEVSQLLRATLETHRPGIDDPATPHGIVGSGSAELATSIRRLAGCADLSEGLRRVDQDAVIHSTAERCLCWLLSVGGNSLTARSMGKDLQASTAAGLTSFAALTGRPVRVETASSDPRYDGDIDTPEGEGDERLLAMPMVVGRRVVGVLTATRGGGEQPFDDGEEQRLAIYAERIAPLLAGWIDEQQATASAGTGAGVFRRAALDHHSRGSERDGRPLELRPVWLDRVYSLLLALVVTALAFVLFGRHSEYAAGPAVVRVDQGLDVTSPIAGTAVGIEVAVGDQVAASQLLVRLYDQGETTRLRRLRTELNAVLAERLRDPSDVATARSVATLRAEVELAEAQLEERSLRSPRAGRVRDLRLRPGQAIQPGDVVLSLAAPQGEREVEVLALLPGHARPQLTLGTTLRLELAGYRYAYQHLIVEQVGNEVLSPAEAMRWLPPGVAETLRPAEPVVFVRARLPRSFFEVDGRHFSFHDGMSGTVEARMRSERLIFTLIPALRTLFDEGGGTAP